MYSPQQEIFDTIFKTSEDLFASNNLKEHIQTVNYLPPHGSSYPFVFIGEQLNRDIQTKSITIGEVIQTVHIYHTHKKQGDLSEMVVKLRQAVHALKDTKHFNINVKNVTGRIIAEPSTVEPLVHGVIDFTITFSGKIK